MQLRLSSSNAMTDQMEQSEDRECSTALHTSRLIYFSLSFIHHLTPDPLFECLNVLLDNHVPENKMFTILYGDKFSVCVRDIERDARHNGAQQRRHSASWDLVSYKLFAEYHSQATFGTLGRVLWTKLTDLDLIYQNYRPRPLVNAVSPFTGASPPTAVSKSEGLRNRNSSN